MIEFEEKEQKNLGFLENNENEGMNDKAVKLHEQATKIRTIEEIELGPFRARTWYYSPYPEEC